MSERLDAAKTAAFTLGPPPEQARSSALLLHGFTGSPWELRPLGEALAARGVHVTCPRLPGHGTTPEAMLFAGAAEWLGAATEALEALSARRRVLVAGLSMGGLLAMCLAARLPTRVQGLVLLAPALRLRSPQARALRRLRWLPGLALRETWLEKSDTDIELADVRAEAPILPRYPLSRVLDLFALADLARQAERGIGCPSLVVGAAHDRVVDTDEVMALQLRLPFSQRLLLQRGRHIIPRDTDRALALSGACHFVEDLSR